MNPAVAEVVARGNPVIFFDISIGGVGVGRISCELFADIVPKTAGMSTKCVSHTAALSLAAVIYPHEHCT